MALQAAHAVEEQIPAAVRGDLLTMGSIAKVILLHPFLAVTPEGPAQRVLGALTTCPAAVAVLAAAVGALPVAAKRAIVEACAGEPVEILLHIIIFASGLLV